MKNSHNSGAPVLHTPFGTVTPVSPDAPINILSALEDMTAVLSDLGVELSAIDSPQQGIQPKALGTLLYNLSAWVSFAYEMAEVASGAEEVGQ